MSGFVITPIEGLAVSAAIMAVLMVGCGQVRSNIIFYSMQTFLLSAVTLTSAIIRHENQQLMIALAILFLKTIGLTCFLIWLTKKIEVGRDPGTLLPIPLAMHVSVLLLAFAHLIVSQFPPVSETNNIAGGGAAGISLIFTGMLFMLTRKLAISLVIGFLTMENGIFLFALTQTRGMPLMIEMGIFLDVLVAVMISGLIIFKIKHSFEHIDVTLLTTLKD